ncbi:MAG: threonine synthase [Deltaproteobacteria bacterium]|nr:threonine synthase [Deltaproteobacteria bacterium]
MSEYKLICTTCGKEFTKDKVEYVCPSLHEPFGILKVQYDYKSIKKKFTPRYLKSCGFAGHERYKDLLPLDDIGSLPPLKVGPTPLDPVKRVRARLKLKNLYIKNDTLLPTGSFKDRASSVVVAKARELKKEIITTASTGNAATALAGMSASVGQKSVIFAPANAPKAKLTQIAAFGAKLITVNGTYDEAFDLSIKAAEKFGWYNRSTGYNPYTIEGKKTAALEIWEQLGTKAPDKVFIPTGDGAILSGTYKGFYDLHAMGLIEKIPQMIPVQAAGSAAIVNAISSGSRIITNLSKSETIADSISVPKPACGSFALKIVDETKGFGITVTDDEIIHSIAELASLSGIFAEPAAAAAYAGLAKAVKLGKVAADDLVVVIITGNGLKDIPAAMKAITIPDPIEPALEALTTGVLNTKCPTLIAKKPH